MIMEWCKLGPQNLSKNGRRAIEELLRGRGLATQLQAIIQQPPAVADSSSASASASSDLVMKILESLNEAISMLKTSSGGGCSQDQLPTAASAHEDALKSEDSSESCKTSSAFKARRGCYKRRRTSETLRKETPILIEDGHSWRKYGQKYILNAKHPRNYFRCTHKYDQGCQATKQVQKMDDDPPRFVTTYYGRHTCQNLLKAAPQIILDSPDHDVHKDSSILLSFGAASNTNPIIVTNNQSSFNKTCDANGPSSCSSLGPPPPPPPPAAAAAAAASSSSSSFIPSPSSVKQEIKQEDQSLRHYKPALLPSHDDDCDYLTNFEAYSPDGDVISGGVYSSSTPSPRSCVEMDMMASVPLDFDDVLQFDF